MENQPSAKATEFIEIQKSQIERRLFAGKIITAVLAYVGISLWLDSIRATMPLWLLWVMIIIQFSLYFSIFITSYRRSRERGLNQKIAYVLFVALAILGRVNDWELLIIPAIVVVMLIVSTIDGKKRPEKV